MTARNPDLFWRWLAGVALLLYSLSGVALILQHPGLQYDEAMLVLGSVHMRHSPAELDLPHDPGTWMCAGGRCLPLMTARYVGAIKEYLCLPLFGAFGTRTALIRLTSMFLGLIGIFGIAVLFGRQISRPVAACVALAIGINPSYLNMTVFDNGTVGVWMGAVGLVCIALSRYIERGRKRDAFFLGLAMGVGIWARANFLWLILAILAAALVTARERVVRPVKYWAAWIAGGLLGGLPFLLYQFHSRGGTLEATEMFQENAQFGNLFLHRLAMLSETWITDAEHRVMWNGPAIPGWQSWLFSGVVLAGCVVCLFVRNRENIARTLWARAIVLFFLVLAGLVLFSNLQVAEHHLVALVPIGAAIVALAGAIVIQRYRSGLAIAASIACMYAASAAYWQFETLQGLRRTGGSGPWSDAIFQLAGWLTEHHRDSEIRVLDWGLADNLYVLTDGALRLNEIYPSERHRPWPDEIQSGGVFVLNGPDNRQFPDASRDFLEAITRAHPAVRWTTFNQKSGVAFAQVAEIQPNTSRPVTEGGGTQTSTTLATGDPRFANQLEGFYDIEEGSWRWTRRRFAILLDSPDPSSQSAAQLRMDLFLPEAIIQKLGPVTMQARVAGHELPAETFATPGEAIFRRDLTPGWLQPGRNRFEFSLDKALPPSGNETRELGIVVMRASIELRGR